MFGTLGAALLRGLQRLVQIRDYVVYALDAHGYPDHSGCHPSLELVIGSQLLVRGTGRVNNKGLGV